MEIHISRRTTSRLCSLLLATNITTVVLAEPAATTVALTTTVSNNAPAAEKAMMANLLALLEVAVSQQPDINVVERMELDTALHELVLNRALGSGEHALELGKLAAAKFIVTARLLEPDKDQKRYVLVRVTQSLSGRILGGAVAAIDELIVDQAAQEIAGYISAVVAAPETAGISIAVAPFDSLGRFDRLRPLERGLRDMVVARLAKYQRFHVLQRSEMRDLINEIDLARAGLSDAAQLLETLPTRRAAYLLHGTIDEQGTGDQRQLIVSATVLNASTKATVASIEFEAAPEELPRELAVKLHRLVEAIKADAGRGNGELAAAPKFDEVEHLFQRATQDLYRFWRRKPRDFSHRDFHIPGIQPPRSNPPGRVPLDSPRGKAMLRKAMDRLESVLYLQPERREAAFALAFCLICHIDDLWQPQRAEELLRNVFHHDPSDELAAAALNWLAEMYYHHDSGDLKPQDEDAARKQILFAFENMPPAHRDYEWTRLLELLMRINSRNRDYHATASLMKLAAGFIAEVEPAAQRNLASNVANMALAMPNGVPQLQAEGRKLLDDWSTSEHKWQRYFALQALARLAEQQKLFAEAAELYRQAAELMKGEPLEHDHHLMLIRTARALREAGDPDEALALLESFQPEDRSPTGLLNGYYGVELGATLEALGKKQEALATYVSYAEASAHLTDNSDVEERITALGGVPLRADRDIDVRYIDTDDERPFHCRSLATDGQKLYVGGDYREPWKSGVAALDLATEQWSSIAGPEVRASCLACDAGYLWVGTDEQGLWRCHLATGTWKNWQLDDGLPDNQVVDVVTRGKTAYVSLGTRNAGGVVRVDAENHITIYQEEHAPRVTLYHLTIKDDRLFGVNSKLHEFDLEGSTWQQKPAPQAHGGFGLMAVFQAASKLWGSTYGREIFELDAPTGQNARYKNAWYPRGLGKAGYLVHFVLERNGQLWFGGSPWWRFKSAGFYRLDLETGEFTIYGPRDGFRLSTTYECYDGAQAAGRIWLATSAGLAEVKEREVIKLERTGAAIE